MYIHGESNNLGNNISCYNTTDKGKPSFSYTTTSQQYDMDVDSIRKRNTTLDSFMYPSLTKQNHTIISSAIYDSSDIQVEVVHPNLSEDAKAVGSTAEYGKNAMSNSSESFLLNIEENILLWLPSEPEDIEDDMELRVANLDEDDDYNDGIEWGQPNSFSNFDEHQRYLVSNKEKRKKAMLEAMHSQFKFLVSRFLVSEGIISSESDDRDGWVDIVSSLSWQAALFIRPDATEGRAMDPVFYVKVKCIAHGSPDNSQVIKGLVFKKNTAHKHMPTSFKNARILLLKGILGERVSGFSSFNSMEQEKDYVKSVIDVIDASHPNVVLVEKTASRDAQEFLLKKGITLVFDMKLPRLEKIARCTGSRIVDAANVAANIELKKCDSFYVEKFIEEHINSTEGGKRSSKTLMFFEGCPKPLGCTILLKGAHSDKLKKIKRVMQFTIFASYHLILETSFFADQRATSFDLNNIEKQIHEKENVFPGSLNMIIDDLPPATYSTVDIMAPNGSLEPSRLEDLHPNFYSAADTMVPTGSLESSGLEKRYLSERLLHVEDTSATALRSEGGAHSNSSSIGSFVTPADAQNYDVHREEFLHIEASHNSTLLPGQFLSSFSNSSHKVEALSSHSFEGSESLNDDAMVSSDSHHIETIKYENETSGEFDNRTKENGHSVREQDFSVSDFDSYLDQVANAGTNSNFPDRDNSSVMSDTQSILILFSSRCMSKETVCEQNHLSRIKYYGNFDMSLGRFLQDILLNQRHCCPGCGGSSETHLYSYTHQNGKLSVKVRRLPDGYHLPGEEDEKVWMWTRCLKCQHESGIPRPTKRVIMSTAARGLSFGKFLELSFSSQSAAKMLSQCGHLLHRDCLRFFGFGSKVAMFRYSSVEIYTACKPPPVIDFDSSLRQEWFTKQVKDVKEKGEELFTEVACLLQKVPDLNQLLSVEDLSEAEETLKQEKAKFEKSLLIAMKCHGHLGQYAPEIVTLPYLSQDLLLGIYVWDLRLCCLHLSRDANESYNGASIKDQLENTSVLRKINFGRVYQAEHIPVEIVEREPEELTTKNFNSSGIIKNIEIEQKHCAKSMSVLRSETLHIDGSSVQTPQVDSLNNSDMNGSVTPMNSDEHSDKFSVNFDGNGISSTPLQGDSDTYGTCFRNNFSNNDLAVTIKDKQCNGGVRSEFCANGTPYFDEHAVPSASKDLAHADWIWLPFPQTHKIFLKDYHHVYMKIFEDIQCHNFKFLTSLYQKWAFHDREHSNFLLGSDGIVVYVREEEISSIVACALTKLHDHYNSFEIPAEIELGIEPERGSENLLVLPSDASTSSAWSSNGYSNLEKLQSYQSSSSISDEVSGASFDSLLENLPSSENLHQNIMVTDDKVTGKSTYSVVCIYAKQFYTLRKRCCCSELDYISSLSRCRKWDAQGGKSKAVFGKTLDDRFIIKEIKRTELDSFLKFGPEYFKHILHSLSSGSQTCLAKILGIYQVKQIKGGKETRHALMVMENLLYGRNVSRTYDLKGAVYARYISDWNQPEKVLLDQNFVEDMGLSPMYIGGRTKHLLQRAIWNDTSFLTSINVMDYSLVVGVDEERHELIFGIIDYLRQYTWDKQLETWVKSSLGPKNSLPTVISPKEYKKRFRKFMSKYFLTVPDSWSSHPSADCCCSSSSMGNAKSS